MKRFQKLGLLVAVLAAVSAATFALGRYEQTQEKIQTSEDVILQIPADTVTAIFWRYADDSGLSFHKEGDTWRYDEDAAFPVSQEEMKQILSHFEDFGAAFCIEDVTDYSQYGLDKPACTLAITTGEETREVKLGDFSKMDSQRYVDVGDGNVYLVKNDPKDFLKENLSDMICNDDTPGFETVVDIRFTGAENYIIQRMEDTNYSYSPEDVYFTQEKGKYLPLDKSAVVKYLNTITSLSLSNYVTYNATAQELETYGLAEPELSVTVNYTYTEEDSETAVADTCILHISRNPEELAAAQEAEAKGETAETVSTYVRIGDSQIVYTLDPVDYGILSAASYNDLRHKAVFWGDMAEVKQMDITLEGETHTLVSRKTDKDEQVWHFQEEETAETQQTEAAETQETESGEPQQTEETQSQEPETLDISALTNALTSLTAASFTTRSPEGKEEIRLTLHLDNESFPTLEIALYRVDGSSCLAVVDGQSVSLVSRSSAMALVEAVQALVLQ